MCQEWRRFSWLFYEVVADKLMAETKVLTAARSDANAKACESRLSINAITNVLILTIDKLNRWGYEQMPAMGKHGGIV